MSQRPRQERQSSIDYASQNEEWMLLYDSLKEDVIRMRNNSDGEDVDEGLSHVESMLMAARVGRLANIQCAILESERNEGTVTNNTASKASLSNLLLHTQHELDTEPQQPLVDLLVKSTKKSTTSSAHQRQPRQCNHLDIDAFFQEYPECIRPDWGMDAGESDEGDDDENMSSQSSSKSRRKKSQPTELTSTAGNDIIDLSSGAAATSQTSLQTKAVPKPSADQENTEPAAPAAAPANPYKNNTTKSNTSNVMEIEDLTQPHTQRTRQPVNTFQYTPASPNSAASSRNGVRGQEPQEQAPTRQEAAQQPPNQRTNQPHNANPYVNQRPPVAPFQQATAPPPPPPSPNQNKSAWANHVQEQNPFQTARELTAAGISATDRSDTDDDWKRQNQRQCRQWGQPPSSQQQQQQQQNPYGYSYGNDTVEPPAPAGTVPGGPHIPDSLRQKFRPPGRINGNGQNDTNQRSNTNRNNNGRSQINRPSSSGNSGGGQRKTSGGGAAVGAKGSGKQSSEDEEELPEELQHLDKELVLKIQNEIMESGETVQFDDIAGLKDAKQTVMELVVWPMMRPEVFTGLRRAPNGLLLFGPPGTGKTLIGKAIANETKATFFSISSSSLTSKWIGEGEKLVKTLFAVAAYREPAVVFIDEIDSLLTQRKDTENEASRRIKTEFLVQLDGAGTSKQGRVLVIGATNRPQELDEAARRRFTKRMYIPLPTESDRRILFHVMLKDNKHKLTEAQIESLAKDTEGFSGADLKALCTDASMGPLRQLGPMAMSVEVDAIPPISFKHFKKSLKGTRPSVAPDDLTQYIEWNRVYGSSRPGETADDDDDDDDDDEQEKNEE